MLNASFRENLNFTNTAIRDYPASASAFCQLVVPQKAAKSRNRNHADFCGALLGPALTKILECCLHSLVGDDFGASRFPPSRL
jgi:hypothetical protein